MKTSGIIFIVLSMFWSLTLAAGSNQYGRRGVAKVMDFGEPEYMTDFEGLEKRSRGTWYSGRDLKNAACYGINGLRPFNAKVQDMIGAMAMDGFEQCYKCMKITNNRNPKYQVTVKIVDKCAACKVGQAIDLTPAAFKRLSPKGDLKTGVLDISFKPVKCPRDGILPKLPLLNKLLH